MAICCVWALEGLNGPIFANATSTVNGMTLTQGGMQFGKNCLDSTHSLILILEGAISDVTCQS